MDLWDAIGLKEPMVVACTGAGGKTSVLATLVACARVRHLPFLLSATTKMYRSQVKDWHPVLCDDFDEGASMVDARLRTKQLAAWFTGQEGDKVIGLPPGWIDRLAQRAGLLPVHIAVEADGARGLLLKASAVHEPVMPASTAMTIGVLNLEAIGLPLSEAIAHRVEIVMEILGKQKGDLIDWRDLAKLALHARGVFQYSCGSRILLLAGGSTEQAEIADKIAAYLGSHRAAVAKCILTEGYGENMRPIKVIDL
ncbi:MAG: hypothetical protein H6Q66_404 [Firmicutes bacterium]|nr:hypothetical protein [Bacillota bacterium]